MTDLSTVENKISIVKKNLKTLERYKSISRKDIEGDVDLRGALERYLYLAVQSTIDLAGAFISYRELRKPSTFGENFRILEEEGLLDKNLTDELVRMTGFRNILVHDYEDLDYDIVLEVLNEKTEQIEQFVEIIEKDL